MLREYRLTNFKAFGETVTIPIRPLTLIFGANSSGKSSIFQSLLLLKQTLEEAKNPNTALLPKGSLVDLGTYRDFVHRHEMERNFEVGARFDLEETDNLPELVQKIIKSTGVKGAGLAFQFFTGDKEADDKKRPAPTLHHIDVTLGDQEKAISRTFDIIATLLYNSAPLNLTDEKKKHLLQISEEIPDDDWESRRLLREIASFPSSLHYCHREIRVNSNSEFWRHWLKCTKSYIEEELLYDAEGDRVWATSDDSEDFFEDLKSYPFENAINDLREVLDDSYVGYKNFLPQICKGISARDFPFRVAYFYSGTSISGTADGLDMSPFVLHPCAVFRLLLENLIYLGPLRSQPERYYTFSRDTTDYVGQTGAYLPSLLFEEQDLVEQLNGDLERLGVKYQVKLDKLQYESGSPSNVFSLRLVDTETGIDASLRDVGFGISQVLPVVVQSRLSGKKTLLIEQPEIHLHPAQQAELGDMFIRSALGEQKNTLLLETHSENLLLRIMRRMRETSTGKLPEGAIAVRPADVMVLFVESDGSQSIVREMPLNERGELVKAWPGGFFEEGLREIL